MYFPTSAARHLSTVPPLPNIPPEHVVQLVPSPRKSLFCTLTRNGVAVWRVRPSAVIAFLSRTPTSLIDHGENEAVHWALDGTSLVIQTSQSYLVLVTVVYHAEETVYDPPNLPPGAQRNFLAGPGEGHPLQRLSLKFDGVVRVEGQLVSVSPRKHFILFSTRNPPSIQRIPWPPPLDAGDDDYEPRGDKEYGDRHALRYDTWLLSDHDVQWLVDSNIYVSKILHSRVLGIETWITSDGRAYFVRLNESNEVEAVVSVSDLVDGVIPETMTRSSVDSAVSEQPHVFGWEGTCIHDYEIPKWVGKQKQVESEDGTDEDEEGEDDGRGRLREAIKRRKSEQQPAVYDEPRRAVAVAINGKFSLTAVGTQGGAVELSSFPLEAGAAPPPQLLHIPNPYNRRTGSVCSLEWASDGYVLAVGWQCGWAVFSVGGRCLASGFGVDDTVDEDKFQDSFMYGISCLFWAPGNFDLFVLAQPSKKNVEGQLFVIPFAKSATTGQHSPDNTRYAFLQMDDRVLVYRGADQPDMSVINPESDVWQHIKIPQNYLATNWPIRYSSLSSDGRLVAIAGRRGLLHYSSTSGRWKMFADTIQEQAFVVKGGLVWFHHVMVAAVEVAKSYQIRLYSRDLELSNQNVLHREVLSSPVVILSLVDNSLLVYTADNTLLHYLIVPTTDTITLQLCGSITFDGIIAAPGAVRLLSWMIPSAQKQLGDPVDDLAVATVLMVVGGQLVLLRPRKAGSQEVKYDMQIFADRIEFCWIHLRGISALENSLWGYDGQGIKVWLNALAIEASPSDGPTEVSESVKESVNIPLDFYPLSVLMDKGIIIGAEYEVATRSNLPFVMFRHATSSHLFLHHILLYHLQAQQVQEAVSFAAHYQHLVFFAHALEILLHTVVESEATLGSGSESEDSELPPDAVLPTVVEFLDYFDAALDVVVGCARKTEVTRWRRLFSVVGNPKQLFESCLESGRLKTAGSYLLVLHNLEQLDEDCSDAVRLLNSAITKKDWQLCRELLRFLHSIDDSGAALRSALALTGLLEADLPET